MNLIKKMLKYVLVTLFFPYYIYKTYRYVQNIYEKQLQNSEINNNTHKSDDFRIKSYSQEGEDIQIVEIIDIHKTGFYVDVGAFDPERFSNTKLLYDAGWQGLNIEPNPEKIDLFKLKRPRDINLNFGVYSEEKNMTYFYFDEPALNTFNKKVAENIIEHTDYKLQKEDIVPVKPLKLILDQNLPKGTQINYMNIDVEGFDFEVCYSNDWNKYKPEIISIEIELFDSKTSSFLDIIENGNTELYQFLHNIGYRLIAKTLRTCIFKFHNNE